MASPEPLLPTDDKDAAEKEQAARASLQRKAEEDKAQALKTEEDDAAFNQEGNTMQHRKDWLLNVPGWFDAHGMKPDDKAIDWVIDRTETARRFWNSTDELVKENTDVEDHSCGPALMITFIANRITWTFFTVLPWVVGCSWFGHSIIQCEEAGTSSAPLPFATYPKSLWLIFFGVTGVLLHYEMRAFAHASVAQVVVAGIPKLAGYKLSYAKFLLVMLIISLIYHFDIFTNGIFIGRVLVTDRCVRDEHFTVVPEDIWHRTIASSKLSGLSGFSFFQWCVAAWASLYLQPLYSWAYAVPTSPQLQDPVDKKQQKELIPVDYDHKPANEDCPAYAVVFRSDQQHGRALQAMSESARMNSLYFMDPDYLNYQTKSWKPTDVHREMQRTNVRFFIFIVETMLPPNLQATFLCFEKAMAYGTPSQGYQDLVILVSVIFSFITGLLYVKSEFGAVRHFHELVKRQKWKFDRWAKREDADVHREDLFRANQALRKAERSWYICLFLAGLGMFFLSYAVVKAIMGTYVCEMGMWNMDWPLEKGCVNLCHPSHGLPSIYPASYCHGHQ